MTHHHARRRGFNASVGAITQSGIRHRLEPHVPRASSLVLSGSAVVSERLQRAGAEVRTAAAAREALAVVIEWKPDVIVSDIAMPGEDGYRLLQRVRALPRGSATPAVAVTAHARVEDRERALAAGFQVYVPKPIEPARLLDAVGGLLLAGR